jgi:hypothetical protein
MADENKPGAEPEVREITATLVCGIRVTVAGQDVDWIDEVVTVAGVDNDQKYVVLQDTDGEYWIPAEQIAHVFDTQGHTKR